MNYKKSKTKKCKECKKAFTPGNSVQPCCSPKCYFRWVAGKPKKEKKLYPLHRGAYRESPEFLRNSKELRLKQIDDLGYNYCEICKKKRLVECHHIVYRSEKPGHDKLHSKINLILLCKVHHDWIHETKQNRKQLVFDRKLNEVFGEDIN